MSFLGNPFDPYVKTQIEKRQEALGKFNNIPDNTLNWYTTKAPWLRLASSVDIDNNITTKLGIDTNLQGSALAKNFILFGGAANESGNLQSGISFSNNALAGEYGWGGIEERGFVPMPGITSMDMGYYNNGSLSRAVVKIRAFSREQFALIEHLYMRPGYSILLEFGHTVYLDNKGNLQQWDKFQSGPLEKFLTGGDNVNQYIIKDLVIEEKIKYRGNYEAMIGKISKFSWNFLKDGSYDITVTLVGYGDIIESLKMNIVGGSLGTGETTSASGSTDFGSYEDGTKFNQTLLGQELNKLIDNTDPQIFSITYQVTANSDEGEAETKNYKEDYISLTNLLNLIQNKLLLYDKGIPHIKINTQTIFYHPKGHFSCDPLTCIVPFDAPDKKYIPENLQSNIDKISNLSVIQELKTKVGKSFDTKKNYSLISIIYVNITYIISIIDSLAQNNENVCVLVDFLQQMMSDISTSLGGINDFRVIYDEETGRIKIIDYNPHCLNPNIEDKELSVINVFGVKLNEGSFVQDINLNSEISNNFSAMISIGAQSNGITPSGNAYSFSQYNKGLTDRIVKERQSALTTEEIFSQNIVNPDDNSVLVETQAEADQKNFEAFGGFEFNRIRQLASAPADNTQTVINTTEGPKPTGNQVELNKISLIKIPPIFIPKKSLVQHVCDILENFYNKKNILSTEISELKNFGTQFLQALFQKYSTDQSYGAPFFLPFNLNINMDGLSGMRLFERFKISDGVLPKVYDSNEVGLIIRAINHTVDVTGWTTRLETLSTPLFGQLKEVEGAQVIKKSFNSSLDVLDGNYSTFTDNNPFNLRPLSRDQFTGTTGQKQALKSGVSIGYFTVFDTLDNGIRAGMLNLKNYFNNKKLYTIENIIQTYAPGGSPGQTSASTQRYINRVVTYFKNNDYPNITPNQNLIDPSTKILADENSIKILKTLAKIILQVEGRTDLDSTINDFDINKIR
jgi:hypothetical protein